MNNSSLLSRAAFFSFSSLVEIKFRDSGEEHAQLIKKELKNLFYLYLNGDYRGVSDSEGLRSLSNSSSSVISKQEDNPN